MCLILEFLSHVKLKLESIMFVCVLKDPMTYDSKPNHKLKCIYGS